MKLVRIYLRVLTLLAPNAAVRMDAGDRQPGARHDAIRRTGAVRQGGRRTRPACKRSAATPSGRVWSRCWRSGWGSASSTSCAARGRALCRPAGALPPAGSAVGIFRARAGAAARLPQQQAFRPADEADAAGHRRAVGTCGSGSSASIWPASSRSSCCCRCRST